MIYSWQEGHIRSVLIDRWQSKAQQRIWLDWFYGHGILEDEANWILMGTPIACDDLARTLTYSRILLDSNGRPRINDDRTEVLTEQIVHRMESPALPFPIE